MTYGCHNRAPLRETIRVQTLVVIAGSQQREDGPVYAVGHKEIPNANSKDCRYDLRPTDPGCAGCRWIKNGAPIASTTQLKQKALS